MADQLQPDRLNVKKELGRAPVFHYDRQKRLAMRGAPAKAAHGKVSLFKKNPSLKIIILDLILVVILIIGVRIILSLDKDSGEVAGFGINLGAVVVRDRLYAAVYLENNLAESSGAAGIAELIFTLSDPLRQERKTVELPESPAGTAEVKAVLPLFASDKILKVWVTIDKTKGEFSKRW